MSIIEEALTKKEKTEKTPEINFIEKKNSSKKIILLILVIILVIILGGTIYFYNNYKPPTKKITQNTSPTTNSNKLKKVINNKKTHLDNSTKITIKVSPKKETTTENKKLIKKTQITNTSIKNVNTTHKKTKKLPSKKKKEKRVSIENLLLIAYKNLEQGKLNEAIKFYNKILKIDNTSVEALINRAIAYQKLNQYSKAESDLQKALKLTNNKAYIFNILGVLYMQQNLNKKAVKFFKLSNTSEAYVNIALIKWKENKPLEVLKNLKYAIMLDSTNAYAYYYLGVFYKSIGEREKAKKEFEKAFSLAKEKGNFDLLNKISKYNNFFPN